MKFVVFVTLTIAAVALANPDEQYTDRYDGVNVREILENDRVLETYFKCLVNEGKCTADAKELKEHMKEALENKCAKCTKAQKTNTDLVIRHLVTKKPEYWDQLTAIFDPDKKYTVKYEKELKEIKA